MGTGRNHSDPGTTGVIPTLRKGEAGYISWKRGGKNLGIYDRSDPEISQRTGKPQGDQHKTRILYQKPP